jgi:AcrR family transcriptional regulator
VPSSPSATQQLILDAAQRITFSRGVSALRMAELAFELGMSKKTLYNYYPSKEALLAAMLEGHFQYYAARFQAVLTGPDLDFLGRLQHTMRLGWESNSSMTAEVTQDFRRHAPALWRNFEQKKAVAVQHYFQQLLADGKRLGILRADLHLAIVADILMEVMTYRLTLSELQGKNYTVPEAFATFYNLLLEGMLNTSSQ